MRRQQSSRSRGRVRRAGAVVGGAVGVVVGAGVLVPALASSGDDGEVLGNDLPLGVAFLIYVCIPVAIIAAIWLLASIPSMVAAPRYRPGLSWWAAPVWFNGPDLDPDASQVSADLEAHGGGGTSARW